MALAKAPAVEGQQPAELASKTVVLIVENESLPFDRRMWNIARALRDSGAFVHIICPAFGPDNASSEILEGISIRRYRNTFANGTTIGYLREYATALVKSIALLSSFMAKTKVHIVHVANPPDIFWPLAPFLKMFGTRFIFDEHDLSPEAYLSRFGKDGTSFDLLYLAQRWFQKMSYRVADVIIATNKSYRANAIAVDARNEQKTFVVRNGPDLRIFGPRQPDPSLKSGRSFLAAYIGVMGHQDGVDHAIRAIDHLLRECRFKDFIVYLIGDGDDMKRLQELRAELRLDDYIVFTGRIPDEQALTILSTADVCLSPDPANPLNERSTMTKIMEYMALGKPIVSFHLKENRYSAGEAAVYVDEDGGRAFGEAILALFEDAERRRKMGAFGQERVGKQLSWQKQSEQLRAAYRSALSR